MAMCFNLVKRTDTHTYLHLQSGWILLFLLSESETNPHWFTIELLDHRGVFNIVVPFTENLLLRFMLHIYCLQLKERRSWSSRPNTDPSHHPSPLSTLVLIQSQSHHHISSYGACFCGREGAAFVFFLLRLVSFLFGSSPVVLSQSAPRTTFRCEAKPINFKFGQLRNRLLTDHPSSPRRRHQIS